MLYPKGRLRLILLLFLCSIAGASFADVEPNDNFATATPLEVGVQVSGDLGIDPSSDSNDYYAVELPANGEVTITATYESGLNGFLYLYRSSQAQITNINVNGTTGIITADCVGTGLVYVRTFRSSGSGTYTLEVNLTPASLDEDTEPNSSFATINETFLADETFTGHLGYAGENTGNAVDTEDWYYVILDDDGQVTLDVEYTNTLSGFIYLYYKQGSQISNTSAAVGNNQLVIDCLAEDTLAVRLTRSSGCGSYSASVSVAPRAIPRDLEPNNVFAEAQEVFNAGEDVQGRLGYFDIDTGTDTEDWYKVVLDNDGEVSMTILSTNSLGGFIYLYGKTGSQYTNTNYSAGVETLLTYDCLAQDTIYIRITGTSGCGDYTANVTVEPPLLGNDAEPNNVFAEAFEVFDTGEAIEGHLGYFDTDTGTDTEDWYKVVTDDDGLLTLTFESSNTLSGFIYFYSKAGSQFTNTSYPAETPTVLNYDCVAQDTVYVRFLASSGCGDYTASVSVTPPPLAGDVEPNNVFGSEQEVVQTDEELTGRLGYLDVDTGVDTEDWYEVVLSNDGTASLNMLSDGSLSGFIYLYSKAGAQYSNTSFQTGVPVTLDVSCLAADTAHIRILRTSGCGSYTTSLNMTPDIYENDPEPNGALATAVPSSGGQINEGHIGYFDVDLGTDTEDWFSFEVGEVPFEAEAELQVVGALNGFIYFYNSGGAQLINTSFGEGQTVLPFTFNEVGTYYVRLLRTSGCGQYQLNKLCGTDPQISIVEDNQSICPGEEATFTASGGFESYEWVSNAVIVGTDQTLTTSVAGTYFVRGFDANGCIGVSEDVTLTLFPLPELEVSAAGSTQICEGESLTLNASAGFASYLWNTGESTQSIQVTQAGSYSVSGITADGCSAESEPLVIGVSVVPELTITPGGALQFCETESVDLVATAGFETYLWNTGATSSSITVNETGEFFVTGTTVDNCQAVSASVFTDVDLDSDEDGVCDEEDGCPNDPNKTEPGECGCGVSDVDSDEDGLADCIDPCPELPNLENGDACQTSEGADGTVVDCQCVEDEPTEDNALACSDGIDNDGDGLIDCDDPECQALNAGLGCSTCFEDGLSFADEVLDYFNNCSNNTATEPAGALGVPDFVTGNTSTYVSLGNGGYVTLGFTNNTLINSGDESPDLYVFEVGPLVESSSIELRPLNASTETILIDNGLTDVDQDGFYEFGGIGGSTADVDIDSFFDGLAANSVQFDAIKIVDTPGSCSGTTPGADIDAVCALSSLDCAIGQPCDDGDETTINDVFNSNCECVGESIFDCPDLQADNGDPCMIDGVNGLIVDCNCLPIDCNGVVNGNATLDECGVCDDNPENDNETCADCAGVPNGLSILDDCGECRLPDDPDFNSTCLDCAGVPNGLSILDECGDCRLPDDPDFNSTCLDCAGVPNGNSTEDDCGVCDDNPNNDNESCADCEGVPNGSAEPGTACEVNGESGTFNENCECIPNVLECSFVYFLSSANEAGGSDIYSFTADNEATEADLTLIASTEVPVSLAYREDNQTLYLAHKDVAAYQTLDLTVPGAVPSGVITTTYSQSGFSGAGYGNGLFYVSDVSEDKVYAFDEQTGIGTLFSTAAVGDGDIATGSNGMVYLVSSEPQQSFEIISDGENIILGFVPEQTSGLALRPDGNFFLGVDGKAKLIVGNNQGEDLGQRLRLRLNNQLFFMEDADLASGCQFVEVAGIGEIDSNESASMFLGINPNPTEGISYAQFSTSKEQNATLEIYDMTGRRVALLFNGTMDAEVEYRTEFDGSDLPNGVYIYRFTVGDTIEMKKFIIAR